MNNLCFYDEKPVFQSACPFSYPLSPLVYELWGRIEFKNKTCVTAVALVLLGAASPAQSVVITACKLATMKTRNHRSLNLGPVRTILVLLGLTAPARAIEPGTVDAAFSPAPYATSAFRAGLFFQAGDRIYGITTNRHYVRYGENGSLDPTWQAPQSQLQNFDLPGDAQAPDGRLLLQAPPGPFALFSSSGALLGKQPSTFSGTWYANADGTWTICGGSLNPWPQFLDENLVRRPNALSRGTSTDLTVSARDSAGRFIVIGNLTNLDGQERLGCARFLPDGTLDRLWNPGRALGLTLSAGNKLNGITRTVVAGPAGEVEIGVTFPDQPEGQRSVFARIRADGSVARRLGVAGFEFPSEGLALAIQPDGRTLVGGTFSNWNGQPVTGLIRLQPDGTVDDSFKVGPNYTNSFLHIFAMGLLSDGYLWFAGNFDAVNGVSRPGLARVFAYPPTPQAPALTVERAPTHIGTNEILYLSAEWQGSPRPNFQWLSNGVPVPGAIFSGLRVPLSGAATMPSFELVASNALGTARLAMPTAQFARRTQLPGQYDPKLTIPLSQFSYVSSWIHLPDGGYLLAGPPFALAGYRLSETEQPMLLRLKRDLQPDPAFGTNGVVSGNGHIERLIAEPNGQVWVVGYFTQIAGHTASGSVLLDAQGRVVDAPWPSFDRPHVTSGVRLADGRRILSGVFRSVNNQAAYRLVRLKTSGEVDETFTSPLILDQVVDELALDRAGRVLAVGTRAIVQLPDSRFPDLSKIVGLRRLLSNGSWDTNFNSIPISVFSGKGNENKPLPATGIIPLPDGRMLLRVPPVLITDGGIVEFTYLTGAIGDLDAPLPYPAPGAVFGRDGFVYAVERRSGLDRIYRWSLNGELDGLYDGRLPRVPLDSTGQKFVSANAAGLQFDATGGLAVFARSIAQVSPGAAISAVVNGILRIPTDADRQLSLVRNSSAQVTLSLPTRGGRNYGVWQRPRLDATEPAKVAEFQGDGYEQTLSLPSDQPTQFFELGP